MAIKLPERNSFTFAELMERWQCTENNVRHLIIEKTLVPSYLFQGLARLVCWEGDKKTGLRYVVDCLDEEGDPQVEPF